MRRGLPPIAGLGETNTISQQAGARAEISAKDAFGPGREGLRKVDSQGLPYPATAR